MQTDSKSLKANFLSNSRWNGAPLTVLALPCHAVRLLSMCMAEWHIVYHGLLALDKHTMTHGGGLSLVVFASIPGNKLQLHPFIVVAANYFGLLYNRQRG